MNRLNSTLAKSNPHMVYSRSLCILSILLLVSQWLPATSNRILSRHKDLAAGSAGSALAALQSALGLSSADSARLAPAPFSLDHRTGEVLAVDLHPSSVPASRDTPSDSGESGPMVLLRVVDETQLHCTVLVWIRLSLLRTSTPRAHQNPSHLCPLLAKASLFNAATLAVQHLDTPALLHLAVEAQQNACAGLAKRIVRESIAHLTHTTTSTAPAGEQTAMPAALDVSRSSFSDSAISPLSPLTSMLLQTPSDALQALPSLVQRFRLSQLLSVLVHQCPPQLTSILHFAQSDAASTPDAAGACVTERTLLVACCAQLLLSRWQIDVLGAELSADANSESESLSFASFESELSDEIDHARESLLAATHSLANHQLTNVSQGQSVTVAIHNISEEESRRRARFDEDDVAEEEEEAQEEQSAKSGSAHPTAFQLQLVSSVLPDFERHASPVRFSKESVWSVRFYADASHTVLLRELHFSADPASRQVAPFVVTSPVFIVSSTSAKLAAERAKEKKAASKASKSAGSDEQVAFSITPFQHESLETLLLLAEAVSHIRRMQIAGQKPANSDVSRGMFSFESAVSGASAVSSHLISTAIRSTSLARHLTSMLRSLFHALRDFNAALHRVLPMPSNLRVRSVEVMTLLMQTHMLSQRALRAARSATLQDESAVEDEDGSPPDSDDESLGLGASSLPRPFTLTFPTQPLFQEAKARFALEKANFPMFSVYLQRLLEMLLVCVCNERQQNDFALLDEHEEDGARLDQSLRKQCKLELPVVLHLEMLLLHATDPMAHTPAEDTGVDAPECSCSWCEQLQERREEAQSAGVLLDLGANSVWVTLLADDDAFPSLRLQLDSVLSAHRLAQADSDVSGRESPQVRSSASSSLSSLLSSFNARLFRKPHDAPVTPRGTLPPIGGSSVASPAPSVSPSTVLSPSSSAAAAGFARASAMQRSARLCDRLLASASLRARLVNLFLNGTSAPSVPRPEIAFKRAAELEEMNSVTSSRHLYRSKSHSHSSAGESAKEKALPVKVVSPSSDVDALGRRGMFQQLVDAFIKSSLHCKPIALRAELGAVTFKCILTGILDAGAAGLPGPFRQALAEISSSLTVEAIEGDSVSSGDVATLPPILIPSPNARSQTGDDRNKMVLNPALLSRGELSLVQCRILGQLLGIAVRSKCCLNLDLSPVIWKGLLELPLQPSDLSSFDFTAARSLKFVDPSNDLPFSEEEFDEYLGYLTWTTVLSDGVTQVELLPGGAQRRVAFAQRHEYAQRAIHARLHESSLLIACIREGLLSVLPRQCLHLLSWRELELRVCGRPTVDLAVLERHTVYSGGYTRQSPIIQHFWQVLHEFSAKELADFLQFCWARSRLPADESGPGQASYRMQVNILDASAGAAQRASQGQAQPRNVREGQDPNDLLLPSSETCFFNVSNTRVCVTPAGRAG
jgi:hypothetical protein